MEVRRLDEGIKLLREELWSFRNEVRQSLESRTTRVDLNNLNRYFDRELYHLTSRLISLEEKAKEDTKHKRQMVISLITIGVGALVSVAVAFLN